VASRFSRLIGSFLLLRECAGAAKARPFECRESERENWYTRALYV
jgi:hypothetical protein